MVIGEGYRLASAEQRPRIVRLGVSVATSGDFRDQPKVPDGISQLLQDLFGKGKCRLVVSVASLPLGTPVELEIIFEVIRVERPVKVYVIREGLLRTPLLRGLPCFLEGFVSLDRG